MNPFSLNQSTKIQKSSTTQQQSQQYENQISPSNTSQPHHQSNQNSPQQVSKNISQIPSQNLFDIHNVNKSLTFAELHQMNRTKTSQNISTIKDMQFTTSLNNIPELNSTDLNPVTSDPLIQNPSQGMDLNFDDQGDSEYEPVGSDSSYCGLPNISEEHSQRKQQQSKSASSRIPPTEVARRQNQAIIDQYGSQLRKVLISVVPECKNDWKKIKRKIDKKFQINAKPTFLKEFYNEQCKISTKQKKVTFDYQFDLQLTKLIIENPELKWAQIASKLNISKPNKIKNRYYHNFIKKGRWEGLRNEVLKGQKQLTTSKDGFQSNISEKVLPISNNSLINQQIISTKDTNNFLTDKTETIRNDNQINNYNNNIQHQQIDNAIHENQQKQQQFIENPQQISFYDDYSIESFLSSSNNELDPNMQIKDDSDFFDNPQFFPSNQQQE